MNFSESLISLTKHERKVAFRTFFTLSQTLDISLIIIVEIQIGITSKAPRQT